MYEVSFKNGSAPAVVEADCYVCLGGLYQFYQGDRVVWQFDSGKVKNVKEVS